MSARAWGWNGTMRRTRGIFRIASASRAALSQRETRPLSHTASKLKKQDDHGDRRKAEWSASVSRPAPSDQGRTRSGASWLAAVVLAEQLAAQLAAHT